MQTYATIDDYGDSDDDDNDHRDDDRKYYCDTIIVLSRSH